MPNRPNPDRITKRQIAEAQLYRAVKLLEYSKEFDLVSALTLAGASEEILGQMVRANGMVSAFDELADADRQLWDILVAHTAADGVEIEPPEKTEIRRRLNLARNELKHNQPGEDSQVEAYFQYEAEDMILRALRNYEKLYNKLPPQKEVQDWWDHMSL